MLYFRTAMEILVAILAILGLYTVICQCCGRLFGPGNLCVTIEILTQRDAASADVLIRDALSHYLGLPAARWAVLTTAELAEDPVLMDAARRYGLTCYVLEQKKT